MRIVDRATIRPARCAVLPYMGSDRGPFVDTGSEMPGKGDQWDFHIYCSFPAIEEMARLIGGGGIKDMHDAHAKIEELEAELDAVRDELARTELVLDSIDVLEGADFRARKKTGRPKKETAAA